MSLSPVCMPVCHAFLTKMERSRINSWNLPHTWKSSIMGWRYEKDRTTVLDDIMKYTVPRSLQLSHVIIILYLGVPIGSWSTVYAYHFCLCTRTWKCLLKIEAIYWPIYQMKSEIMGLLMKIPSGAFWKREAHFINVWMAVAGDGGRSVWVGKVTADAGYHFNKRNKGQGRENRLKGTLFTFLTSHSLQPASALTISQKTVLASVTNNFHRQIHGSFKCFYLLWLLSSIQLSRPVLLLEILSCLHSIR